MSNEPTPPESESTKAEGATPTSWNSVSSVIGETLEDAGATVSTPRPATGVPEPADEVELAKLPVAAAPQETPAPDHAATPPNDGSEGAPVSGAEGTTTSSLAKTPEADAPPARVWKAGELKLVIEQGMSVGKEFLISEADMTVGRRDPDQSVTPDIDLFDQEAPNNRYISRRQARLFFREGQLMLEDLDSSNGTALNGHLVAPHEPLTLALNDKVHFGQSVLLRVKPV